MKYTRDEAVDKVMEIKSRFGSIPTKSGYEKIADIVKLEDLEEALGVKGYAAVNIEVLRAVRIREGRTPILGHSPETRF